MLSVRNSSGLHSISGVTIRDSGNVLRVCKAAYVRDAGNALRTFFYSGGTVEVTPSYAAGYINSKTPVRIITSYVTVSITGGVAPYTIAWTFADAGWNATTTSPFTGFRSPSLPTGSDATTSGVANVTDANGTVFLSDPVEITASNLGNS